MHLCNGEEQLNERERERNIPAKRKRRDLFITINKLRRNILFTFVDLPNRI